MRLLCTVLALVVALSVCGKLHAQRTRERLAERLQDLSLTADQETKIADIRKECRPKVQEAAKELAAVLKDEMEKVRAVLNPAQKTKLEGLKEEHQQGRPDTLLRLLVGGAGRPPGDVPLGVGAAAGVQVGMSPQGEQQAQPVHQHQDDGDLLAQVLNPPGVVGGVRHPGDV
jgi:hypothetical protein